KISKFYLSLSAKDVSKNIDERKFKSNWLEIRRPDGSKVHYFGIYCRPDYYSLENNVFIMRKNSDFVIDIRDIYYNYYFVPGEMVIIKYNGPLGESNEIECKIGNILPYE
ncbi:hypothetical protein, partial [Treponema sp.]|uniref:hypothetical protein n=1 Tax=Treponema sp. TaxID=166 RepID=UPI0038900BCA